MEETILNYRISFPYGKLDLVNLVNIPKDIRDLIEKASSSAEPLGLYVFSEMTGDKYSPEELLKHFEYLEKLDLLVLNKKFQMIW